MRCPLNEDMSEDVACSSSLNDEVSTNAFTEEINKRLSARQSHPINRISSEPEAII